VRRHASTEELASLAADDLKPRKAAKISAHLAICAQCQQVTADLAGVSTLLASTSVQYEAMPDQYTVQINAALRAEVNQRLASEPVSAESGRRELPSRSGRVPSQGRGWRLPGLSVPATRLVAAAGAVAILGGGGYAVATHVGSDTASTAGGTNGPNASIPRAAPASPSLGPRVTFHRAGATESITAVRTNTNFVHATLGAQAAEAVAKARRSGIIPMTATGAATAVPSKVPPPSNATSGLLPSAGAQVTTNNARLDGCVANVAGSQKVLLVELAKYNGNPATVIVLASSGSRSAEVWVVGDSCSASDKHAITHLKVART
jgi:hypothetical protein